MNSSQIVAACEPLEYPFWFELHDGTHVTCSEFISLDGASITFISGSAPRMLFLHQIKACVQNPIKQV